MKQDQQLEILVRKWRYVGREKLEPVINIIEYVEDNKREKIQNKKRGVIQSKKSVLNEGKLRMCFVNDDDLSDRSIFFFEYPLEVKAQQFCLLDL